MHRCFTRYAPLAALTIIMVLMAGCSGGYGPTLPSPDGGGDPMAVMIGPSDAQAIDSGSSVAFNATLQFPGNRTEDATERVSWSWTGAAGVGSVSEHGVFTAGEECGRGAIVARYDGLQYSVEITVRVLTGLTVTPASGREMIPGETLQFTATATYCGEVYINSAPQQATTRNVTNEANWSWTGAADVGSIDAGGTFTAGRIEGQGQVRASFGDLTFITGTITVVNRGDVPINISQLEGGNN